MQPAAPGPQALAQSGVDALRRGDSAAARRAFDQVVAAGGASPQLWLLLARACDALDDRAAASQALDRVLEIEARNLPALLLKGDLFTRDGDDRAAVSWYKTALGAASGAGSLDPGVVEGLRRAEAAMRAANERFQQRLLASVAASGIDLSHGYPRFAEALDILSGAKAPHLQQPTSFYYPRLPQIAFYEREMFPWIAALEAAAAQMRAEIGAVLADDRGVVPYVERPENRPSKAHSLLDDARWSAFHLWKEGERVEENASRCPAAMAALEQAPIPRIRGRSPMALFSILKPGTHIEPHHGMLNTRLICHIPLIVPAGCRLRVGNETRTVEEGRALIFDDSIEHEAWNDGDGARAILLFEIWRPELSAEEQRGLTAMFEAITDYSGTPPPTAA